MAGRKKTKRESSKLPGLEKRLFSKVKQEYFDIDYADQLTDKEKMWLSQFQDEFLGANLQESKNKKYGRKTNLHKSKKHRKSVFDANNARNRDVYSKSRAMGVLDFDNVLPDQEYSIEDRIIERIDLLKQLEKAEFLDEQQGSADASTDSTDKLKD